MIFRELIGGKCLCGTVGPWVKVPKALEEDTLMWVYEVGPALGF